MASYHLTVKNHSRSKNANTVALASYRSGEKLYDERTQTLKNCRKDDKSEILHSELFNSNRMNREQLWNAAEKAENRKNSVVAREVEIALPVDISNTQKVSLARDFCKDLARRYRCAVDLAVHAPDADGDQRNYHAHILMTTREVGVGGMGAKWRQLNQPNGAGRIEMAELRKKFELLQNSYLERAGCVDRVSSGRASEMDLPKKYVALPFKKYQVMRREDRVEEYKQVSGEEEFVKWKSRKELEIEDLAGEIESLKREESLEDSLDPEYCYDPVQECIDRDIEAWEEQKKKDLEQRSDGYGNSRAEAYREGLGGREDSYSGEDSGLRAREPGLEEFPGFREGQAGEFGEAYFGRGSEGSEWLESEDRGLPGWLQRHFDGLREGFREQCESIERSVELITGEVEQCDRQSQEEFNRICRRRDEDLRQREERVDKLRREHKQRFEDVSRRTEQSNQRTHEVARVYSGTSRTEQCRRGKRAIRRGSYAGAVKQLSRRVRAACQRFGELAKEVGSVLRGIAVGGVKRKLEQVLSPFVEKKLPEEVRMPAKSSFVIERSREWELDDPDWSINVKYDEPCPSLGEVPILDESSRIAKFELLGLRQDRSLSVLDKVSVGKVVGILQKYEAGQELLKSAVDTEHDFYLDGEKVWKEVSVEDKKILLPMLERIKGGVKETVREKCPEIVKEVEKKFSFRRKRDNDQSRGRGRSL